MRIKKTFDQHSADRVAEAIRLAESKTSGEIVPVVLEQSDPYAYLDFIGGVAGQLLGVLALIWTLPACNTLAVLGVQVLGFVAGFLLVRYCPPLKRVLLPPKVAEEEVFDRALRAFREFELDRTRDRTGVLIFVSRMERRIQVLADSGINARVSPGTWNEVVALVLSGIREGDICQGLCEAIERCGQVLAREFPLRPDDINELPNRLQQG